MEPATPTAMKSAATPAAMIGKGRDRRARKQNSNNC
jgi:hypothetical protein